LRLLGTAPSPIGVVGIAFAVSAAMLAHVRSATVIGIDAKSIDIEVEVGRGLPGTHIVGLPDAGVKEGRVRIQEALANTGFKFPPQKVVVNLAPADLRKDGASFDVPIAVGILSARGQVQPEQLEQSAFVGELALDGRIRPVQGVLPLAAWAEKQGYRRLFVPTENAAEAQVAARKLKVVPVESLAAVVDVLAGASPSPIPENVSSGPDVSVPDMADVRGQLVARRALEIAAAGGHNLIFVGPPGSGKSMLALRLPGILPPLEFEEALETTTIYSVAGLLAQRSLIARRPFRAPHHTVSVAGLVGGGPSARPGEISLAHNGVLFLDELLEFPRRVLESLRQPLEDKQITIVRARRVSRFPSNFTVVAALNPCPCGHYGNPQRTCVCSGTAINAYRSKLSGPLLDRMDMHVHVPAVPYRDLSEAKRGESSEVIRKRVVSARRRQLSRAGVSNAKLRGAALDRDVTLERSGHTLLARAVEKYGLSARAVDRVRRVARTIADLGGDSAVTARHLGEALQYRYLDRPVD